MSQTATSTEQSEARRKLEEAMESLLQLRPMPSIATQLMNICQSDEPDMDVIIELIECDPFISLRALKIANSPIVGAAREIVSIPQAIVMLGFRRLSELASSIASSAIFSNGNAPKRSQTLIFNHSLGCATIARHIAAVEGSIDPSIAFLSGMLHDVGKLVLLDYSPDEYSLLLVDESDKSSVELEQDWVGTTHCDVGLRYGESWGLPLSIREAIRCHHENSVSGLAKLVADANRLSRLWGIGSPVHERDLELDINTGMDLSETLSKESIETGNTNESTSPILSESDRSKLTEEFESLKQLCCAS